MLKGASVQGSRARPPGAPARRRLPAGWPALAPTLVVAAVCATVAAAAPEAAAQTDWPQFGFDAQHSGVNPRETAIGAGNVATLQRLYHAFLPDTVDGAPAFLSQVSTPGGVRDLLFMTTTDGRLLAADAATGNVVWEKRPASGPRYTTSSPAIDPSRQFVYSYGLEGMVHKYRVGDGGEVTGGGWPQLATLKPDVEKGSSALAVATSASGRSFLYVANGGYPGDQGDYQGHLTAIDLATGSQRVWNAACSDQHVHFVEHGSPDCPSVQTAIWSRAPVVYDPAGDRIFMATGNGLYDASAGGHDWGDSDFSLRPDGTGNGALPLDSYTPSEYAALDSSDTDLGSTAPALLPAPANSRIAHLGAQSGKDGMIRLLNLDDLSGMGGPGHVSGEIQKLRVPQGGGVLTAPAVWRGADAGIWLFVANGSGISGLQLTADGAGNPSLAPRWTQSGGCTSPVVANGVVFCAGQGAVRALDPASGGELWRDEGVGVIHWQSPIVVNGRLYLTDNQGALWAYRLAALPPPTCTPDATTLCLNAGRFQVIANWVTADGLAGPARAVPLTSDTGYLWFFNPSNVEVIVKVLNGCSVDKSYWVFAGGLTNVRTVITVTDTRTGAQQRYINRQGIAFQPIQDTSAFPSCP
ncbi:MAG TPA: PQQ-binding-like beta-propeller repeat protein [Thermoanaerobaculia bacterium]|nr:PQQ-binding-like beta-propeller repeat protein [Thermoanaerobaculia bacterium]